MLFVWIGVMALSIVTEIFTRRLIALWFLPAGLCSLVLYICHIDPLYQILACLGFAAVGILLSRIFFKKRASAGTVSDAVMGKLCTVTERVDDAACGQVMIDEQYWAARGVYEDDIFEKGETATVVAVEGVKLILKKS
ncbi:MAG: NfeD family protein [Clostridia bacterium]|nr:NfeD family protein [Clostridia bacterium]